MRLSNGTREREKGEKEEKRSTPNPAHSLLRVAEVVSVPLRRRAGLVDCTSGTLGTYIYVHVMYSVGRDLGAPSLC